MLIVIGDNFYLFYSLLGNVVSVDLVGVFMMYFGSFLSSHHE